MKKLKQREGITLIALIITIIVLLILAGITINLTIGQDGILTRAEEAGRKHQEAEARQKLEMALLDLQAEKIINREYDENGFIDSYLTSKQMIVMGNIVVVDGWKFEIDRSIPEIRTSLEKGEESKDITITANVENAADYTKASINIEIFYEGELSSIQINGQDETIPEKTDGKYVITKEVLQNGTYTILAKDANDSFKTATADVTEISEDLEIWTWEELVAFRDRVNKGATYEERTITLMDNIDLSSVCYRVDGTVTNDISWEPISKYEEEKTNYFKGTFNGDYKVISNLYINSDKYQYTGLFSSNYGTIKNLIIENANIYSYNDNSTTGTAAITGENYGTIENCGVNSGIIKYEGTASTECYFAVGSIAGANYAIINNCYNGATIESIDTNRDSDVRARSGGIAGANSYSDAKILNCYNKGIVKVDGSSSSSCGGVVGQSANGATVENSYSYGSVSRSGKCISWRNSWKK